ncbi:MAG: DUF6174 domain-containing protein [Acidimicrobiales bacterium]
MNNNRLAAAAIGAALVFSGLTACSDSPDEVVTGDGGATSTTEVTTTQGGGDTGTPDGPEASALDQARQRWAQAGIADYDYEFTTSCECGPEVSDANTVRVRNGRVVGVEYQGMKVDRDVRTVEQYFDSIQAAIDSGVAIDVTYEEQTGRPIRVFLDTEAMAADGGDGTELVAFDSLGEFRERLDAARAAWSESGLVDYSIDHSPVCFCPIDELVTKVVGGEATSTVVSGTNNPPGFDGWSMSIDDMFEEIESAFDSGAARVTATFDDRMGYPTEYYVDVELMMADEEYGMVVRSVSPSGD